jgi:rhamnose utilization protein RhaD (predicted bifunctional aldolase and dehydrogenase)
MAYKVFISHSTRDQGLVIALSNLLSKFDAEVNVAEWYLNPGEPLDKKIWNQIRDSDCMVVLLTKHGVRSNWVQQEIGYALKSEIPVIPLVEKGVNGRDLGSLISREYIEFDPNQPESALNKASSYVKTLKLKKRDAFIVGGIVAFLLLLAAVKK